MIFIKINNFSLLKNFVVKSVHRKEKTGNISYFSINEKNEFSNDINIENKICYIFIDAADKYEKLLRLEIKLKSFNFVNINDYYNEINRQIYNQKFELAKYYCRK